jgi:putative inorganic carbon (HCO3(-)) transporter
LFSIFPLYFVASSAIDSPEKMKKIIKALVLSAATVSTLGIVQFFSQFIFGIDKLQNFWAKLTPVFLGNAFSQAVAQYPSWLVNISGATYFRALGTFPDPHMFSFFLGLVLPLAVCLFFSENKPSWLFATGLIFLANILTFSRGGYLALVAGLLALFFIFWKRIGKKYKLAALLGSLALILALIVSNPVSERFFSSFNLQEGSNLGRIEIWKKTLKNISERPLTGTGIGNFPLAVDPLAEYRDPIYAHNTYLDIAVEAGILASLVWIGILFSSIRRFLQNSKGDILHLGAALSLIVFAAHSFVETGLYSPVVLTLLILILTFSNIQKIEKIS